MILNATVKQLEKLEYRGTSAVLDIDKKEIGLIVLSLVLPKRQNRILRQIR